MQLATDATNANGNALANQEKYMDSYAGMIQSIKTEFDSFAISLSNDSLVKFGLGTVQDFLSEANDEISEGGSALGQLLAKGLQVGMASIPLRIGRSWAGSILSGTISNLGSLGNIGAVSKIVQNSTLANRQNELVHLFTGKGIKGEKLTDLLKKGGITEANELKEIRTVIEGVADSADESSENLITFSDVLSGIGTSAGLSMTQLMGFVTVLGGLSAVVGICALFEEYNAEQEKMKTLAQESAVALQSECENLESQEKSIAELRGELDKSTTSESRRLEIKKELISIQNSLSAAYDIEAGKLDLINGKISEQINLLEDASKKKLNEWLVNKQPSGWLSKDKSNKELGAEAYEDYTVSQRQITYNPVGKIPEEIKQVISSAFKNSGLDVQFSMRDGTYLLKGDKNTTQLDYSKALENAIVYIANSTALSDGQKNQLSFPLQDLKEEFDSSFSENQNLLETYAVAMGAAVNDKVVPVYENIKQLVSDFDAVEDDDKRDSILSDIEDGIIKLGIGTDKDGHYKTNDEDLKYFASMLNSILGDDIADYRAKKARQKTIAKDVDTNDNLSSAINTGRKNAYRRTDFNNTGSEVFQELKTYAEASGLLDYNSDAQTVRETVSELIDDLVEMGEIMEDVSDINFVPKASKSAEEAVSSIKDLSDAVSGLDSAFSTLEGGTSLDASGIASLKDTLSGSGLDSSDITAYVNQLVSATGDASKQLSILKQAKLDIANAKIDLNDYSGDNLDYMTSQLEALGYTIGNTYTQLNAEARTSADQQVALISNIISKETQRADNATKASEKVFNGSVLDQVQIEKEASAVNATKQAYASYIAQKLIHTGVISVSGDLVALSALCNMLGIATNAWNQFYAAKAGNGGYVTSSQIKNAIQTNDTVTLAKAANQNLEKKGYSATGRLAVMGSGRYAGASTLGLTASDKKILKSDFNTSLSTTSSQGTNRLKNIATTEEREQDSLNQENFKALLNYDKLLTDWKAPASNGSSTGTGSGSGDKGSSDTAKEETQDWIDWYERRITVLQKLHDAQEEVSNDEMKSYTDRAAAVSSLIDQDKELLEVYNAQADNYKDWYNTSLDEFKSKYFNENGVMTDDNGVEYTIDELKSLIENGGLEASSFTGDKLEDINSLISSYDEYKDIVDKIDEKEKEAADHWKQYYEMRISELDEYLTLAQGEQSQIENQISIKEALGKVVQASDYQSLISSSKEQVGLLEDQIDTYEDMLGELREGSSEYNQVLAKIQSCESSIYQCKLNQIEWNESIKNIPITRIEKYLNVLSGIQSELTDYMSNQESKGNANTADQYEELMSLGQEQLSKLLEQQKLYKEKLSDYEWGSDKYDETVTSIDDIDSSISSVISSMTEWSQSILSIPINKLSEVNENLQATVDALDDISSKYDEVISAVTDSIDDEIDKLNDERDATEDAYQDKIDAIQDVIDALEKENEAREKQLAIEDAQYDLEKAYNNKSVATIQNGKVVYEADQEEVRSAIQALDEANYNKKIYDLEQQIEDLEDERDKLLDDYDDRIDKLQDISDKWSEITTNIQHAKDVLSADEFLGDGWLSKVLSGNDDDIYTTFKNLYETLDKNRTSYEEQIESNNRISTLMQNYVDAYVSGSVTYEKALAGVQELTSQIATGLSETENLTKLLSFFDKGDLTETLKAFNDTAVTEANNYEKYFEAVKANAELTDKYTKTWEDMKTSIEEQVKTLKEAYEAAVKAAETAQETAKTYSSSSGGGGNTVSNTYVVISSGSSGYEAKVYNSYSDYQSGTNYDTSRSGSLSGSGHSTGKTSYFHEGLEKGYVGALSSNDRLEALKKLSLTPLKDNEVPAILKAGEVVMTTGQQDNLLKNVSRLGVNEGAIVASSPSVTLNMSNLTFNEVQNGQDFANFITKNITTAVAQNLSKK